MPDLTVEETIQAIEALPTSAETKSLAIAALSSRAINYKEKDDGFIIDDMFYRYFDAREKLMHLVPLFLIIAARLCAITTIAGRESDALAFLLSTLKEAHTESVRKLKIYEVQENLSRSKPN